MFLERFAVILMTALQATDKESMSMPRLYLRLPRERTKTFRIYLDNHPINDVRIAAISDKYIKREIDFQTAKEEAYKVIRELRNTHRMASLNLYPDANQDVYNKIKQLYQKRDRTSESSKAMALAGVRRCMGLLGNKVIHSVSLEELKEIVRNQDHRSRQKMSVWFNVLLKAASRTEFLSIPQSYRISVNFLTIQEMIRIINHLKEVYKLPAIVAFSTGCRLGEVFGISKVGRKRSVYVDRQMYEHPLHGEWYGRPKWVGENDTLRWTPVIEWGWDSTKTWITLLNELSEAEKIKLRRLNWGEIVRNACRKAFPNRPNKHLTFRDLRHCYAVYWLEKGATSKTIADAMGNSEAVVNKHYHGFVMTDEMETLMLALEKK